MLASLFELSDGLATIDVMVCTPPLPSVEVNVSVTNAGAVLVTCPLLFVVGTKVTLAKVDLFKVLIVRT